MSDTPLLHEIVKYIRSGSARFHTPGHKGNPLGFPPLNEPISFDVTELPDIGSLMDETGAVRLAEQKASHFFGFSGTFFSAGGCTLCIQTMLRLVSVQKKKILCGRNIHRSALYAMALLDLEPLWLYPRQLDGFLSGRIEADDVEVALQGRMDIGAVYLTCPDYYGVMSDIRAISGVARKCGVPVIVDNAHGAHLIAFEGMHPLFRGAAMSADSAHKTLPVLTGGAWLQVSEPEYREDVRQAMALFASTSPSFLILSSLDFCRDWLGKQGKSAFGELKNTVNSIKKSALGRGFLLPGGECDPVRITLNARNLGYTGHDLADYLREHHIEPEYSDEAWTILIPSPFNKNKDLMRLYEVIGELHERSPLDQVRSVLVPLKETMPLRDALFSHTETIPVGESVGRLTGEIISPCPPGVPLVIPGEQIEKETAEIMSNAGILKIKVVK